MNFHFHNVSGYFVVDAVDAVEVGDAVDVVIGNKKLETANINIIITIRTATQQNIANPTVDVTTSLAHDMRIPINIMTAEQNVYPRKIDLPVEDTNAVE